MMNRYGLFGAALAVILCSWAQAGSSEGARRVIQGWPQDSRQVAERLIERNGHPDLVVSDRLEWRNQDEFKRIVVSALPHEGRGIVEHTIRYDVPSHAGVIGFKDALVVPDSHEYELSAFSDRAESNFMALNMANDVMTGSVGVDEAGATFDRHMNLRAAGKSSEATERLLFRVKDPAMSVHDDESAGYIELN